MRGIAVWAWLLGLLLATADGWAQEQEPAQPPLTTLHLYANLAQVPVLVLDSHYGPMSPVPFELFGVSVDSGKSFTPTRVRREGDDPISVSILLDVSGVEDGVMRELPKVVETWAAGSLLAHDRVSVYALDCALVRTGDRLAGNEVGMIRTAVDLAIDSKTVHGAKGKPACWSGKRLWDTLDLMTAQLEGGSGRRVILAVTDGHDGGSKWKWTDVRLRAAAGAVAVFAMSGLHFPSNGLNVAGPASEDQLNSLCQLSGGVILPGQPEFLAAELRDFVKMVHDRYIVEFPRPKGLEGKQHSIEVTIRKRNAVIRPAGLSMTVETAEERAPENQPTEPSAAPEPGTRKVLVPQ